MSAGSQVHPTYTHGSADPDELAASKLWAVYISEADKYDKSLVEGWKSDMEGLLIFAGLFSASLTDFVIESYKTLTPDQGEITIAVLAQISRQLEPGSNASAVDVSQLMAVGPTSASLACNILWFLSLWFSLSCALIATLVEQWSRDFIQTTALRPSPIIRARIFAYLYFGLQKFGMHATVRILPLLLHVSLVLFFAGLIAFLHPINAVLTTMAIALLGAISITYMFLTVLPMFSSDSPYRTPLSNITWAFFHRVCDLLWFGGTLCRDKESGINPSALMARKHIPTMTETMMNDAVAISGQREGRDARAMVWTVRSLENAEELDLFVDALPDLIWGPNGRRRVYDRMITLLDARHSTGVPY
ncbi:hypothetical protein B0H14DRAFT_365544 [Mycena olivaceomarginata]|nr:hypothetical protein B0H14DRAFT_365544 [Mycena olivaceomarginata]